MLNVRPSGRDGAQETAHKAAGQKMSSSAGNPGGKRMRYHGAWLAAAITGLLPFGLSPATAETIGVFTKAAGNPIARAVRAGADQVAKANGMTVFHYIPTSPDNVSQQTFLVEEALRQKRDAIVFTPVDIKAMVPSLQKI